MSTVSQRSFTGGEISPKLRSRVDFNKYQSAAAKIRNFIPLRHGGLVNRPGSSFSHRAKDYDKKVRLIPFEAGSNGNFILEFGMQYIRFFKDGSLILSGNTPYTISNITVVGSVATVFHNADGDGNLDIRTILSGISGDIGKALNGVEFECYDFVAGAFKIRHVGGAAISFPFGTGYTASTGQFQSPYELSTSYNEDDLFLIKYAQSVDVLALSHRFIQNAFLKRNADNDWQFDSFFGDNVGNGTITSITQVGTAGSTVYDYAVACVYNGVVGPVYQLPAQIPVVKDGLERTSTGNATLSTTNYNRVNVSIGGNWDNVYVYRKNSAGIYGFVGIATVGAGNTATFDDIGYTPDINNKYPDFSYNLNKAGAVGFVQQRLWYGDFTTFKVDGKYGFQVETPERESVIGSVAGQYGSFFHQQNVTDDGTVKFTAANRKFNPPRHIMDLSKMVIMTENCELVVNSDGSPITPSNLSVKAQSYNGCSEVPPIIINESALFIQARGNAIRDLTYNYSIDGFSGNEISLFADHLFEGYQILDWCFQNIPNSNVWAVRDDGKILCLTYLKEQDVLAWSQHDLDNAKVKSIACIPGGSEDFVYMVVERTINGQVRQYIEYLNSRFFDQELQKEVITDESATAELRTYSGLSQAVFVDSASIYDGRNFDTSKKVKLTSAIPSMTPDDIVTMTANFSLFKSTDVGNQIFLNVRDSSVIRCSIVEYTSPTSVQVTPSRNVPTELIGNYTSDWAKAVDALYGLHHLEGKKVSVFSDGFVDANPFNESYIEITVTNGKVTLPFPRSYVTVGLPYISDLKTLKIDSIQSETTMDKRININKLTMNLLNTRGLWVGINEPAEYTDGLFEMKPRNDESYDKPVDLRSEPDSINIETSYTKDGQVFVRQIDPVPATILSVHPAGSIPFRSQG